MNEFIKKMLELLPTTYKKYRKSIEDNGKILETVVIEDVFMPYIIELLQKNKNDGLLKSIFGYFEEVSIGDDNQLSNVFSITVLEILGNDKEVLKTAQKYMGFETMRLQVEADKRLGRVL